MRQLLLDDKDTEKDAVVVAGPDLVRVNRPMKQQPLQLPPLLLLRLRVDRSWARSASRCCWRAFRRSNSCVECVCLWARDCGWAVRDGDAVASVPVRCERPEQASDF